MSTTRATNARHVRQRKLNTKQPLRIIREDEIEEQPEDEANRHIPPQVETGVEKAEEIVSQASLSMFVPLFTDVAPGIPSAKSHPRCQSCCAREEDRAELHPNARSY